MSASPKAQPAFIDNQNNTLYYLAFDRMLVAAPIRNSVAYIEEGRSIKFPTDFNHLVDDALHAAIQQILLEEWSSSNSELENIVDEARSLAARIAADAQLSDASLAIPANSKLVNVIIDGSQINLPQ